MDDLTARFDENTIQAARVLRHAQPQVTLQGMTEEVGALRWCVGELLDVIERLQADRA